MDAGCKRAIVSARPSLSLQTEAASPSPTCAFYLAALNTLLTADSPGFVSILNTFLSFFFAHLRK